MNLAGAIRLGAAYLRRQKAKTLLLVGALSLAITLPAGITVFVREAEAHLRSRAGTTPLLLGAPGSALELAFNGLHFSKPGVASLPMKKAREAGSDDLARVIPLDARFSAQGYPVVGTRIDYFRFRNLKIAEGRLMTRLGDCVLGAEVAEKLGLGPGDSLLSSPESVFDLAGVYPLKMRITGVLGKSGEPDDRAVFTDLASTWVMEGLAHGHQDATKVGGDQVLKSDAEPGVVALNASVVEYTEITDENVSSFHFHGDEAEFPITAAIVIPDDNKSRTILLGRYQEPVRAGAQLIEPVAVMDELFDTVFQVQRFVVAALAAVGVAALAISLLVFLLSNRLRQKEFASLRSIGADPATIRLLVTFEGAFVLLVSAAVAAALVAGLSQAAPSIVRMLTG